MRQAPFSAIFGREVDQASGITAPELVVPPASLLATTGTSAWFTANAMVVHRFQQTSRKSYRWVNTYFGAASGNIQVGVASLVRSGTNVTVTKVRDSGVIACPGTGAQRIDLGAFTLDPGDFGLFLFVDNTTATVNNGVVTGYQGSRLSFSATLTGTGLGASATAVTTAARFVTGLTLESDS